MKNKENFIIISILTICIFSFVFIGCSPGGEEDGENNGKDGGLPKAIAEFAKYLSSKPDNTRDEPYVVTLKIDDVSYFTSLKEVLLKEENKNKYVYLDLSGSTITAIPDYAFNSGNLLGFVGCGTLAGIIIPDGVTSIGRSAFDWCANLASVTMPPGVTSIGGAAFRGCASLATITIPDGVTSIGSYTFYDCASLESIAIPDGVEKIGSDTFYGCASLTSITIGSGVASIGDRNFEFCDRLTAINVHPDNNNYSSVDGVLYINTTMLLQYPNYKEGNPFVIPDSVDRIAYRAFYNCTRLTSVTIPDSVYVIEQQAFQHCTSLTNVTIPDSVYTLQNEAFSFCENLISVTIGSHVTRIFAEVFSDCARLTSIIIPSTVIEIRSKAFLNCASLAAITIPNSVTIIGENAFDGCAGLISITIGSGITDMKWISFPSFANLTNIIVDVNNAEYSSKDGVLCNKDGTSLIVCPRGKTGAFTIPSGVNNIGEYAFYDCTSLISITFQRSGINISTNNAFIGDLRDKYLARGTGTYTRASLTWTKQ